MWIVIKTVSLTVAFWGLAVLILASALFLTLSVCATRLGIAAPTFPESLSALGALVTIAAAIRFAIVAPLITYEKDRYGPDWKTIQWPPPPEPIKISQDVRTPSEVYVKWPTTELRVHLNGK